MNDSIKCLEPKALWENFYQLTQIPRPSKHEQKAVEYLMKFGKGLGLETLTDAVGNVVIKKGATKGYEHLRTVVLQAHIDMVPQKNSGIAHNFETDAIKTYIDGDWVSAEDTTLGADNGIGAAAMMAVLQSNNLEHGPIEALFTVDEETGMTGAFGLKDDFITNDILLNLDNEDDQELGVGCAGGINTNVEATYLQDSVDNDVVAFCISLKELKGGHSGMDIILNRGNAIKLLNRVLNHLSEVLDIRISFFKGGDLRNAIPREAFAEILVSEELKSQFEDEVVQYFEICKEELKATEPDMVINIESCDLPQSCMSFKDQQNMFRVINACPNGVIRMSDEIDGLVETSSNLAIFDASDGKIVATSLQRSSVDSAKDELCTRMRAVFELGGYQVEQEGSYPGWNPNTSSTILKVMKEVYTKLFNSEPNVLAVHAGLECGIIGSIYPGIDSISFGPVICYPHSPDERVSISSVSKFWDLLVETLKCIPEK